MHSKKLYCIADGFIAQQEVLPHSRKVSPAAEIGEKVPSTAETGEKFLLQQKLEKSSFCGRNKG